MKDLQAFPDQLLQVRLPRRYARDDRCTIQGGQTVLPPWGACPQSGMSRPQFFRIGKQLLKFVCKRTRRQSDVPSLIEQG